jgi:hypothetical protein
MAKASNVHKAVEFWRLLMNGPDRRTREARLVDNVRMFLRLADRQRRPSKDAEKPESDPTIHRLKDAKRGELRKE